MNLLTHKKCPKCKGIGSIFPIINGNGDADEKECPTCKGTGEVPVFYTPAEYKRITDKDWPDDAPVWEYDEWSEWKLSLYLEATKRRDLYGCGFVIIANELGKPPADYRTEAK